MPRTTTSTRSATGGRHWKGRRIDGIGNGLLEGQRLALGPCPVGICFAQALAAGSSFLRTQEPAKASAGPDLLGGRRGGQTGGPHRVALFAGRDREVVELQRNPRHILSLNEQLQGRQKIFSGCRHVLPDDLSHGERMSRPYED